MLWRPPLCDELVRFQDLDPAVGAGFCDRMDVKIKYAAISASRHGRYAKTPSRRTVGAALIKQAHEEEDGGALHGKRSGPSAPGCGGTFRRARCCFRCISGEAAKYTNCRRSVRDECGAV